MATALFIKPIDIKRNTIIDGSVDVDKFIHKISSDIIADSLTGDYLSLVNTYIQPMLIHFAMVDYLPFAAYQVKNGGVFKHSSENSETVSKNEVDYLVNKEREFAEYYTRRFIDYMANNQNLFPEYTSNTNEDINPDKDATFNGWVL